MAKLTKGTHLFVMNPTGPAVVQITGVTAINLGGSPAGNVQITDLEDTEAHEYMKDLMAPGIATLTIQADPNEASHILLHTLAQGMDLGHIKFVLGWSDGTAPPTITEGAFVLPATRTWFSFRGDVQDFPFDFQMGAVVQTQVGIQRSGKGVWTKKT